MRTVPITLYIFSDVDNVTIKALVFRSPMNNKHAYIWRDSVWGPHKVSDWDYKQAIEKKYGLDDSKMLSGFNSGSCYVNNKFWMLYQEDCFDPSCFVTMGSNDISDVIDDAVDSFEPLQYSWDDIERDYSETDDDKNDKRKARIEKAIDDGIIGIADGGLYYHNETLKCHEIELIGIELE